MADTFRDEILGEYNGSFDPQYNFANNRLTLLNPILQAGTPVNAENLNGIATAAETAQQTANGKATVLTWTATINATWTGTAPPYTKAVSVTGLLATDIVDVAPNFSTVLETRILQREAWNLVGMGIPANGSITFYCDEEKPITAIPIKIRVVR